MTAFAGTAVAANGVKQSHTLLLFSRILEAPLENAMKFETYGNCFVCGENNPNGLRLSFEIDKEKQTLRTTFIASPTFQGWDGIVHGGIISTLLDEAMAKLVFELGHRAVTASLEVKFKKPAPILEPLHIFGEIAEVNKRLLRARAHVAKEDGTILATGTSTFLKQTLRRQAS
jgi:uncharacterized protein (TIGR00369 family)